MTITGLSFSAYYLYNPIWVRVTDLTTELNLKVTLQGITYDYKMTPYAGVLLFDLAKIVSGLISEITNKSEIVLTGSDWIVDGAYQIEMNFNGEIITKTFVLGGKNEYISNVPVGNTLSLTLPKWENFPMFDFDLVGTQIIGTPVRQTNSRKDVLCDDAYILFRNRLGGFSGYLFEDFDIEEKAKNLGYYITDTNLIDSGSEIENEITLRTKLKREDNILIQSLIDSKEVYRYKTGNKLVRLVGGNSIKINPKLTVQDFSIKFDIPTNYAAQW